MNVLEAISARRSVRDFERVPVASPDIRALLQAAVQAPNSQSEQPWAFAVVQDRERLQRYSDGVKSMAVREGSSDPQAGHHETLLRSASFDVFHGADTLIAICATQPGSFSEAAVWLATENLLLAACALGLGTCCVGLSVPFLNTPTVRAELAIPAQARVVASVVIGHARGVVVPGAPRLAPSMLCWLRDLAHRST